MLKAFERVRPRVRVKLQVCLHVHVQRFGVCLINCTCKQTCKIIKFNILNMFSLLLLFINSQMKLMKPKAQSSSIYRLLYENETSFDIHKVCICI